MSKLKFHLLKVGQQFEFRGEHYTKIAPLIASNDSDGKQKMIPRSALVSVMEQGSASATTNTAQSAPHPALEVVERYHQAVLAELQSLGGNEEQIGAARARLEGLKLELLQAINGD